MTPQGFDLVERRTHPETLRKIAALLRDQVPAFGVDEQIDIAADTIAKLEAENARLREAMEPFAREADDWSDKMDCETIPAEATDILIGDLRKARAALSNQKEPDDAR